MNDIESNLLIEIFYNKEYFSMKSGNNITFEEIKKLSIEKFSINNNDINNLYFTCEDDQGDINIINTIEDIYESIKEISPDNYYSKIKLEIIPFSNNSTNNNNNSIISSKKNKYEEENKNLKLKLEELQFEKNKEINSLKEQIEKNKKKIIELQSFKMKKRIIDSNEIEKKESKKEKDIEKIIIDLFNKEKENLLIEIGKTKKQIITEIKEELKLNNKDIKEKENDYINQNKQIKELNLSIQEIISKLSTIMKILPNIQQQNIESSKNINEPKNEEKLNNENISSNISQIIKNDNKNEVEININKKCDICKFENKEIKYECCECNNYYLCQECFNRNQKEKIHKHLLKLFSKGNNNSNINKNEENRKDDINKTENNNIMEEKKEQKNDKEEENKKEEEKDRKKEEAKYSDNKKNENIGIDNKEQTKNKNETKDIAEKQNKNIKNETITPEEDEDEGEEEEEDEDSTEEDFAFNEKFKKFFLNEKNDYITDKLSEKECNEIKSFVYLLLDKKVKINNFVKIFINSIKDGMKSFQKYKKDLINNRIYSIENKINDYSIEYNKNKK